MSIQHSRLLVGRLLHDRRSPKPHRFEYGHYWMAIDLSELAELSQSVVGFSHNQWNILSIRDRDYLDDSNRPILDKIMQVLATAPYRNAITAVTLVTSPRYFGKVFNPINFYYCYSKDRSILCILAEVNNTFSESHLYILDTPTQGSDRIIRFEHPKEFYVSPFNNLKGTYTFKMTDLTDSVDIRLNLSRDERPVVVTRFWGQAFEFTSLQMWKTVGQYPFLGLIALAKIGWNAIILKLKGIPTILRPRPSHANTFRRDGIANTVATRPIPPEDSNVTH
jgi:DUF1365 family protein